MTLSLISRHCRSFLFLAGCSLELQEKKEREEKPKEDEKPEAREATQMEATERPAVEPERESTESGQSICRKIQIPSFSIVD